MDERKNVRGHYKILTFYGEGILNNFDNKLGAYKQGAYLIYSVLPVSSFNLGLEETMGLFIDLWYPVIAG